MENGQYRIFSYQAVCDDWYGRNQARIMLPKSLTDKSALIQYKEAGFNTLFPSYAFQYNAMEEEFNDTKLKKVMDLAHEVGFKCIIFEKNLHRITGRMHSLIDPENADGQTCFSSEEELDAFVKKCIEEPMKHPAFLGVSTMDEPRGEMLLAYGQALKALKKAMPNIYVNANICLGYHNFLGAGQDLELTELGKYRANLETYCKKVDPEFVQFGMYPIKHIYNRETKELLNGREYAKNHLASCCMASEFCVSVNKPMSVIMQSAEWTVPTAGWGGAKVKEDDLYLQANVLMAVGTSIYSYWSYYPPINSASEYYDDKATIVDTFGRPNELYYVVQDVHRKMQRVAPVLTEFKYRGVKLLKAKNLYKYSDNILTLDSAIEDKEIATFDDGVCLTVGDTSSVMVTALDNKNTGESGYYLINVTDPQYKDVAKVTAAFGGAKKLKVYFEGEESVKDENNGKFNFELNPGRGVFVIPIK